MPVAEKRSVKLDLRLTPSAKRRLQVAAETTNRSVTDFVLECALNRADEIAPDRYRIGLNAEQWEKFLEALDADPQPAPRLAKLLQEPSVFERGGVD